MKITNQEELRAAVTKATNAIINMSNSSSIDDIAANFVEAKDEMIEIMKYKVCSTSKN